MATTPTNSIPALECADQVGSINTTTPFPPIGPYVPPTIPVGDWEITDPTPDECAINEQQNQEQYAAEQINISGAPLNIYRLLGIHEQGEGSVLDEGRIFTSSSFPGHPASGINDTTPWWSLAEGNDVVTSNVYVGVDFGIKQSSSGVPSYEPNANKWTEIGAIVITQSNTPEYFATQVRVDATDGQVVIGSASYTGTGNGALSAISAGSDITQGSFAAVALTPTTFAVTFTLPGGTVLNLGTATVGTPFNSTYLNVTISAGATPFVSGDIFTIPVEYTWRRVGVYTLVQSPSPQIINLKTGIKVRAVRVTPTVFPGTESWEVVALDVLDSPPTNINNIQDLFFGENRDRDYAEAPILVKAQYTPNDSSTDLSRFGLSILDQYVFTFSYVDMVTKLGRPIVTGDIIEVIPELQWDQNLRPVRKFLEVTDTGWSSAGFTPAYKPIIYRVSAQIALPSQETRDIFGTLDTQKFLTPDAILADGIGEQLNTTPLDITEDILKTADDLVPETGSDDVLTVGGVPMRQALPPQNAKGQPAAVSSPAPSASPAIYIESALPPNGEPYGEGFALPVIPGPADGDYFRLYYAPETKIAPRLYRFSITLNRWVYLETDRRGDYSSHKPSAQRILQSPNNRPIGQKL